MRRWQTLLIALLMAGTAWLTVSLFMTSSDMTHELEAERKEYRDNIMYYASRFEKELLDFLITARRYHGNDPAIDVDDVLIKFDIFWSRASLFNSGALGQLVAEIQDDKTLGLDIIASLEKLDPLVTSTGERSQETVQVIEAELLPFVGRYQHMSQQVGHHTTTTNAALRRELTVWIGEAENVLVGLLMSGGLLIVLLFINQRNSAIQLKNMQQARQHAEDARVEAILANEAKSSFLRSMSHELRTPLNAILGFAQLIQADPDKKLNRVQKDYVGHILHGGNHLLSLINQVLELSKIEAGQLKPDIEPLSPRLILDESLILAQTLATSKSILVQDKSSEKDLPAILADPTQTKQVLLNLLSNGVKYNTENGQVCVDAEVLVSGFLRFSVEDTGIGVSADAADKLFQPFARVHFDVTGVEGTGIGLSISKQLVDGMGGQIGYDALAQGGSRFWFDLPLATESNITAETQKPALKQAG